MTDFSENRSIAEWHRILHRLWTRDVGTPGYNKRDWLELEAICMRMEREAKANDYQGRALLRSDT